MAGFTITYLPTLTTFVCGVMYACIMRSRATYYCFVGAYRGQMCICILMPNVHTFRMEQVISNENSGVISRGK